MRVLRILVTFDMLLSQVGLSTDNVMHVILDTMPSLFYRVMLKSWELPGNEAKREGGIGGRQEAELEWE